MVPFRRGSPLRVVLAALLCVVLLLNPASGSPLTRAQAFEMPIGQPLGSIGRYLAVLDLNVPRPRFIHTLEAPAYTSDLALHPTAAHLAMVVTSPMAPSGDWGSDLHSFDLATGVELPLLPRADPGESFDHPQWWPDGSVLIFQREDLTLPPTTYFGAPEVYYSSRIEMDTPGDTASRVVLAEDARFPAPSPDGLELTYVRRVGATASLLAYSTIDGRERSLVGPGQFLDIAYPRFSPDGATIAFLTPDESQGSAIARAGTATHTSAPVFDLLATAFGDLFRPETAQAHGFPWNLWLMNADASDPRLVDLVQADEGALTWLPDSAHLFVHGGTGSYLVHAYTADVWPLPHVAGYGATVWLGEEQPLP